MAETGRGGRDHLLQPLLSPGQEVNLREGTDWPMAIQLARGESKPKNALLVERPVSKQETVNKLLGDRAAVEEKQGEHSCLKGLQSY